jgi:hypothetical protein
VQWEPDGSSLFVMATLVDDLVSGRAEAARVSAELRQHADAHGLTPKAMLQLRWRIAEQSSLEVEKAQTPHDRGRAGALKVITGAA